MILNIKKKIMADLVQEVQKKHSNYVVEDVKEMIKEEKLAFVLYLPNKEGLRQGKVGVKHVDALGAQRKILK